MKLNLISRIYIMIFHLQLDTTEVNHKHLHVRNLDIKLYIKAPNDLISKTSDVEES